MPNFVAITPDRLAESIAAAVLDRTGHTVIAVDGADAADPVAQARRFADALREVGRSAHVVALHDFIRPASLRLEFGRSDEMSYRTAWFDYSAVRREVLDALRDGDRWLPALWDEHDDRSARAAIRRAHPGTVLIVAGPMLLGRDLAFDLTVRLDMSEAALRRRTPEQERWTIEALLRHRREHPADADFSVRWDHPDRPALLDRTDG
ncbi:hypothetical protein [Nocardia sp. NPDC005366]|uniref:hypothetical protein n=1 Tax=Nocardia sp. NPDC005366 TaxID=3156878 RepID=UPI0033B24444